jgi:Cu/Ag efflux pump CusA
MIVGGLIVELFVSVILALSPLGGFLSLLLTGTHFSVSSGLGFLALIGVFHKTEEEEEIYLLTHGRENTQQVLQEPQSQVNVTTVPPGKFTAETKNWPRTTGHC